jgi:phosphatidylinositol-3-phosphatase
MWREASMRISKFVFLVCLVVMAVGPGAGTASAMAGASSVSGTTEGVPRFGHVFLIIGENTTYSHLTTTNAPYLMSTLRPRSAWLSNFYATTHWSQANYVALTSGQFTKCEQQDYGVACHQNVDNLFHQIDLTDQTWTTWLEGGTARCDTGSGSTCPPQGPCPLTGFYTTGNPAILYDDVEGANGVWSATDRSQECLQDDIYASAPTDANPMKLFDRALANGTAPTFNLVLPNGCEDGEGNCKPVNNRYTQFDDFLAREVPKIMASPSYGTNGVIIITYDEDQRQGGIAAKNGFGAGGHIPTAIISPLARRGDYATKTYAYSLLRTIEDGMGLSGHVGNANAVSAINQIWK